jgi:hypothetical protein
MDSVPGENGYFTAGGRLAAESLVHSSETFKAFGRKAASYRKFTRVCIIFSKTNKEPSP